MIDAFSLALAIGPLAIYILVVGFMQCAKQPIVTTGVQDTAALGIAVSGLLMVGPLNLFFPTMAYGILGWIVWAMLAMFFCLTLLLIILMMRPRMVIYAATVDQVREPLLLAARSLDPDARMEGPQVWFPKIGTSVRIEAMSLADTPQIIPQTLSMSPAFWRRLVYAVRQELATVHNPRRTRGAPLVFVAVLLLSLVGTRILIEPQELVAGFREWLRL